MNRRISSWNPKPATFSATLLILIALAAATENDPVPDNQATSSGVNNVFVWQGLDDSLELTSHRSPDAAGRTLDRHFEVSRKTLQNRSAADYGEEDFLYEPKETPDSSDRTKRLSASNVLLDYLKNQQERDAR